MSRDIVIISLVVGLANYLFRYMPLRYRASARKSENYHNRYLSRILDGIGIASICALLVVSSVPTVLHDEHKLAPTLAGFALLILVFFKTRSIVIATLSGALCYGLVFKFFAF